MTAAAVIAPAVVMISAGMIFATRMMLTMVIASCSFQALQLT